MSDDVLKHLGEARDPGGYYSGRVKYSIEDDPEARAYENNQEILEKAETERTPSAWDGVSLDHAGELYPNLNYPLSNSAYGEGKAYSSEAIRKLLMVKGDPNRKVRVFAPVDTDAKKTSIKPGQTVYPSVAKAREEGARLYGENGFAIAERDIQAKYIFVNERSVNEWGYDRRGAIRRGELEAETRGEKQVKVKVPESKPTMAKAYLRQALTTAFSIPEGYRNDANAVIDRVADKIIKNGQVTEIERQELYRSLFEMGIITVETNDPRAKALRDMVRNGKIYVDGQVKAELGDSWDALRRRAFANGMYLVTDRDIGARGIDQWNMELAEAFPGIFFDEDTDLKEILYNIVETAEEARGEHMTLDQYAKELTGEYGLQAEDDFLDNLDRQFDYAMRSFAESAKIELKLRDRTGEAIAREREAAAEAREAARTRQAARRAREREWAQEARAKANERRILSEMQAKTLKQLQWLDKNRDKAPDDLRAAIDEVLSDIDTLAVSAAIATRYSKKYDATLEDLGDMYEQARVSDPNFMPSADLDRIMTRLKGRKIGDIDIDELGELYKAAVGLRTEFYNRKNVLMDERHRLFQDVVDGAEKELEDVKSTGKFGFSDGKMKDFLNDAQLSAVNYFERMFGWNPDSEGYLLLKQLETGERNERAYKVKAEKLFADFIKRNKNWVKRADGQGKNGIWYEKEVHPLEQLLMNNKPVKAEKAVKIYFTPAQKIHMYLESRNYGNLQHMIGGRTFADKELYSRGLRDEAFAKNKPVPLAPEDVREIVSDLTPEDVREIVSDLTPEEQELADLYIQYYDVFSPEEINKVSNAQSGYSKAGVEHYAKIYADPRYTRSEPGVHNATAEGVGSMHERIRGAKNPSLNISCFEAFDRHVEETAKYVGLSIPVRNVKTFLNWQQDGDSVKAMIGRVWGEKGYKYIESQMKNLQSEEAGAKTILDRAVDWSLSNYISAMLNANPSVMGKQFGSIFMAAPYLGLKNVKPINMGEDMRIGGRQRELIAKYTQELDWRSLGYATPEVKHLKDNPGKLSSNKTVGFLFQGNNITWADTTAASVLWPWAVNKVRRENPGLEVGSKEIVEAGLSPFYRKVAEEFNDAVARSQSTSDQMHQGELRKHGGTAAKAFTMFKSDSAQAYNILRQKIGEAQYYKRSGNGNMAKKTAKEAGTAFLGILASNLWAEAVGFAMAWIKRKDKRYRDDDDELTAQSVAEEVAMDMIGSLAGVVAGGEELADLIGNVITGDRFYSIDMPGGEQLNEIIETAYGAGKNILKVITDGVNVAKTGGDFLEYLNRNSGDIRGNIKDIALTVTTYGLGVPASNVEAYLMGILGNVIPGFTQMYEDVFSSADKSGLAGLTGAALETRVNDIFENRIGETSPSVTREIARLYEGGERDAMFGETPTLVGDVKLTAGQKQKFDRVFASVLSGQLDKMIGSEAYVGADDEIKAKMLNKLYDYASAKGKESAVGRELDGTSFKADIAYDYGIDVWQYLAYMVTASTDGKEGISQDEAKAAIDEMGLSRKLSAVLFQLTNKGWKSNPYDEEIGAEVYNILNSDSESESTQEEKTGARWENGRLVLPKFGESRVLPRW